MITQEGTTGPRPSEPSVAPLSPAGAVPPYAVPPVAFGFPSLAACAARAVAPPDRELALGALMAARLAWSAAPDQLVNAHERAVRADRARQWLAALPMPQQARLAFFRAFDASTSGAPASGDALAELARTLVGHLDPAAERELSACADRLRLYYEQTP